MESIEIEAKTIEEAISIACEQLQTVKDNLKIEVLQEERNKFFTLMSGKKAKIRATVVELPQAVQNKDIESSLKEFLETVVKYIFPAATVEVKRDGSEMVLNILGDGSGIFIGKRGQTLNALQYLISKVKGKQFDDSVSVIVDSESYRSRHSEKLINLARELSKKAKRRNGPVTTNPLNSADRRIVHLALKDDAELTTWSKGEGDFKKVIIAPKQSANN